MSTKWDEVNEAIEDAERTIKQADNRVKDMARIIRGRLQACNVGSYALCELKTELRRFNMHTGVWKD